MVDINRRSFKDVDWVLLLAPIALTLLGCPNARDVDRSYLVPIPSGSAD